MTALKIPKKILKEMDKSRRRFLWAQDDEISGGKCKVSWDKVCCPLDRGGLGILDLLKVNRALRMRWQWLAWTRPAKPWVAVSPTPNDHERALFASATSIRIGNGKTANFWKDTWFRNEPLSTTFPALFSHARRKNRSVGEALTNEQWIADLQHGDTAAIAPQFLQLWRLFDAAPIAIAPDQEDEISWKLNREGAYTAKSAYQMQCQQTPNQVYNSFIWKVWAPNKLKMFMWLLIRDRLWCNDRLQRRGWPNGYFCPLCTRNLETSTHLIWSCSFSQRVWGTCATWSGCSSLAPATASRLSSAQACHLIINKTATACRRGIRSLIILIAWELWRERNHCVFQAKTPRVEDVLNAIRSNIEQWRLAGARCLESPFGDITSEN